jgi:hypothetical protein
MWREQYDKFLVWRLSNEPISIFNGQFWRTKVDAYNGMQVMDNDEIKAI